MKKSLLLGITGVTLVALTATTLYAQTVAGSSLVDKMKAVAHTFTLSADLNPGQTGFESAPVAGKKTGNMLTAGEWNRVLELLGQGGGSGSGWENVLLTGTENFDDSCMYRFKLSASTLFNYVEVVGTDAIYWYADGTRNIYIAKGNKTILADSAGANRTVTKIEKLCGGGGGTTTITGGGLALYKCTNAQSLDTTNLPCYGASRNGGAGTNQYRVVSCTDNDGIRSYTMSSILNFGQLVTNKWAVSVNGGTIECDDGTVLVMDTTGNSSGSSGMSSPIVKTKYKPTTSSSLTFDIPAGSRYATATIFGSANGYGANGAEENNEKMEIFFDFQNSKSSGIHSIVLGNGADLSLGYSWEGHAFGTRVALKEGDDTLSTSNAAIWMSGVRPTVSATGNQLTISGLSNQYWSQTWMVTFY